VCKGGDSPAAAIAESELMAYENDAGSLLRQHQQRLQQAKNDLAIHRRQQDKLRVIEAQEEEDVKALQQSNRVLEMQIMSLMKEKDNALSRAADDKRLTAAARAERDDALSKQLAVTAELEAVQVPLRSHKQISESKSRTCADCIVNIELQGELERISAEVTQIASRRDAICKSIKEKEQV
jgi:hypothetical protein